MSYLNIAILGSPEVRHGERVLTFRTRKTLALLVYLVAEGGRQSRERLCTLLWPESEPTLGRAILRTTLGYLNASLALPDVAGDHDGHLVITREALGFDLTAPHTADLALVDAALAVQQSPLARADEGALAGGGGGLSGRVSGGLLPQ